MVEFTPACESTRCSNSVQIKIVFQKMKENKGSFTRQGILQQFL